MSGKFYIAAPYNTREGSLHKVREIERLSGWTCNARWVLGLNDGKGQTYVLAMTTMT